MLFKIEDFQVEFDIFTPRPHLIILNKKFPQNGSLSADQESQIVACYEQIKQKLKGNFLIFLPYFNVLVSILYLNALTQKKVLLNALCRGI